MSTNPNGAASDPNNMGRNKSNEEMCPNDSGSHINTKVVNSRYQILC